MANDVLIDDHVSTKQCEKAIEALLNHALKWQAEKDKTELLGAKEQHVWLNITVKNMHPEKKLKPFKIPIVHPIVDPRTSSVCLITKDPQREYKDLLETNDIRFVSQVIGLEKLKGKHKPFDRRRLLLNTHDIFLADERVIPLLPGLLGKGFFKAKKQPIPVNLTRKNLKGELEGAINSTYFHQNQGTNSSIKIGTLSHTSPQILANLQKALPALSKRIKGGWDNIQSLQIKTSLSMALPIWSCDLGSEEGGRWDGLVADAGSSDSDEDESDEEMEVEAPKAKGKKAVEKDVKGKKRAVEEEDEVETEKPKKKAKSNAAESKAKAATESSTPTTKKAKVSSEPTKPATKKAKVTTEPVVSEPTSSSTPAAKTSKKRKAGTTGEPEVTTAQPKVAASKVDPVPASKPKSSVAKAAADASSASSSKTTKSKVPKAKKAQPEATPAEAVVEPKPVSAPIPAESTPDEPPAKKKRRKGKQADIDSVAPAVSAAPSEPIPVATVVVSTEDISQPAEPVSEVSKPKRRKKAKAAGAAEPVNAESVVSKPPAEPSANDVPPSPAPKSPSKSQPTPAAPQTPAPSKKQKKVTRATATDFFDDGPGDQGVLGEPATPAAVPAVKVPPNTPADGLIVEPQTPVPAKGKRQPRHRTKGSATADIEATPISGAIGKLKKGAGDNDVSTKSNDPDDAVMLVEGSPVADRKGGGATNGGGDGNGRALDTSVVAIKTSKAKGKKKSGGVSVPEASVGGSSPDKTILSGVSSEKEVRSQEGGDLKEDEGKKKKKRSKKPIADDVGGAVGVVEPVVTEIVGDSAKSSSGPTPEEVKKKRSSSGAEKKKAKVLKGKKSGESAKEALIGKKGL